MRIIVCVKQVYDPKSIRISRSREDLDMREAVLITNPPDRYALEAALRLREAAGGEVIALTVGDAAAEDTAREAVAIGADRAVLVTGSSKLEAGTSAASPASDFQLLASNAVTRLIAAVVDRLAPVDLVLTGQLGLPDGTGGLAPRLAAALGWPVALDVVRFAPVAAGLSALVAAPEGGQAVPLATPAVAAVLPGAERPRYPYPARIANAWEPGLVETLTPVDLGLGADDLAPDAEPGGLILGPERVRGQVIGGSVEEAAAALVGALRARRVI